MARIQEFNNQEFLKELRERVKFSQLSGQDIAQATNKGKEDHLIEMRNKILQDLDREEKEQDELLAKSFQE
jgi:hypothetical protein